MCATVAQWLVVKKWESEENSWEKLFSAVTMCKLSRFCFSLKVVGKMPGLWPFLY